MYCSQLIMPDVVQQDYVSYPTRDIQSGKHYLTGRDDVLLPFEALRVTRDGFIIDVESQKVLWKPKNKKSSLKHFYYKRRNTGLSPLRIYLDCFIRNKYDYDHVDFLDHDQTNMNMQNLCFYAIANHNANCGTGYMEMESYNQFIVDIQPDHSKYIVEDDFVVLDEVPGVRVYPSGIITDYDGKDLRKVNSNGYLVVYRNGNNYLAHRLVASAFVPNPFQYNIVNHINGDKKDNRVVNLEWVNNSLNIVHGWLLRTHSRAIGGSSNSVAIEPYFNLSITSHQLIGFIKERIMLEKKLPPEYWVFSNAEPFRALFLILIKHSIFKWSSLPEFLDKSSVFRPLDYREKVSLLNNLSNRHAARSSEADHIVSILTELNIELHEYLKWIIFDLKNYVDDDCGFLYAEEMHAYKSIMRANNRGKIYLNTIMYFTTTRKVDSKYNSQFKNIVIQHPMGDIELKVYIPAGNLPRIKTFRLIEEVENKFEPRGGMKATNGEKKRLNINYKFWYWDYL